VRSTRPTVKIRGRVLRNPVGRRSFLPPNVGFFAVYSPAQRLAPAAGHRRGFIQDDALSRGAAIAYYTLFSLAPILLIAIAIAGLAFGPDAARGAIVEQLSGLMGSKSAEALQAMIESASDPKTGMLTGMFAAIFKILPDTPIDWRDVAIGALFTAGLFEGGKYAIALYIGKSDVASSYGAAGALIILLLWIFYSAQIFLLGAEFTRAFARRYGSHAGRDVSNPIPS
jgi:uncharacterized BrkB/YihY/UPF0761 family membrane protein